MAGGYYPRLSKAARDLLADWTASRSSELQQAWPRLPGGDKSDGGSATAAVVEPACTAICVAMPATDGTTPSVMPYAVDITRLKHAARTISGCWEGCEWFKDDAHAKFAVSTDSTESGSGGTSGIVSVGGTVEVRTPLNATYGLDRAALCDWVVAVMDFVPVAHVVWR